MNCLYITLFFNVVAGIVQTFIKSSNQLLYPRVIEVCRLHLEPSHDFFLHLIIVVEILPLGEETSRNRWSWGPDCTADGPIYPSFKFALRNFMTEGTLHLWGFLNRLCYFKHVSLKQSRFYHCQTSTAHS